MKIKFTTDKGYAKSGTVEDYPEEEANRLISEGVAEAFAPAVIPEEKEDTRSSILNIFKGE